jgi:hypothetical protein
MPPLPADISRNADYDATLFPAPDYHPMGWCDPFAGDAGPVHACMGKSGPAG